MTEAAYICVIGAGAWLDSGRRLVVGVVLAGLKRDAADPFPRLAFAGSSSFGGLRVSQMSAAFSPSPGTPLRRWERDAVFNSLVLVC